MLLIRDNGLFYQAYSVMNAFLPQFHVGRFEYGGTEWARVNSALAQVGGFATVLVEQGYPKLDEAGLLVAYLTAEHVGIIPQSSKPEHIKANSAAAGALDDLPKEKLKYLGTLLEEWLRATHGQPPRPHHAHVGDEDL